MKKKRPPKSGGKAPRTGASSAGTKWIPSATAKSDSSLKDLVYAPQRVGQEWESSGGGGGGGTSISFHNPEINYIPEGGQIQLGYTVTPSNDSRSLTLETTSGTGQATFADGSSSQSVTGSATIVIKGVTVSNAVGNISLRVDDTEQRSFTVIRANIQARQPGIRHDNWVPETKDSDQKSLDNLIGVWPGVTLRLRVRFTPAAYQDSLPADFIKWTSPYGGGSIPPNTVEQSFQPQGLGPKRIEISFPALKQRRLVYVDVPQIGTYTEVQAAGLLLFQLGGSLRARMIENYAHEAEAWALPYSDPQRDAIRHAYWMALCASDPSVGAGAGLLVGKGHEVSHKHEQQAFLSTMDLQNNDVGALIVLITRAVGPIINTDFVPDRGAIQTEVLRKYQSGQLWIWEGGPAHPDNTDGLVIKSNGMKIFPAQETIP